MTSTMSRSEREAMEEFAIREWCLKETVYGNLLCKNIEIIYHKMMIAWSIPPNESSREDKYIELCQRLRESRESNVHWFPQPEWKPTLEDIEDDIFISPTDVDFNGKLMEVLGFAFSSVTSLQEPLTSYHIDFVKNLLNTLGVSETSDLDDDESDQSSEADYGEIDFGELSTDEEEDSEDSEKRKESCMDALNLLDSVMNSGECMKEVDYLKMCNLLKELYN
jgi:hypothetical protein